MREKWSTTQYVRRTSTTKWKEQRNNFTQWVYLFLTIRHTVSHLKGRNCFHFVLQGWSLHQQVRVLLCSQAFPPSKLDDGKAREWGNTIFAHLSKPRLSNLYILIFWTLSHSPYMCHWKGNCHFNKPFVIIMSFRWVKIFVVYLILCCVIMCNCNCITCCACVCVYKSKCCTLHFSYCLILISVSAQANHVQMP